MRKFWRRFLVYFVIFVAAAAVFGLYRHFSETPEEQKVVGTEEYTAWGSTRLPVVYTTAYGHEVDVLHAYSAPVDATQFEDYLMPVGKDGTLPLTVMCYGNSLKEVSYEVRTRDNIRKIAAETVADWTENHETAEFTLNLAGVITQTDREYRLMLKLVTTADETLYYYTRIRREDTLHLQEMLDYVMKFHDATFDKAAAAEFAVNLENDGSVDDTTLAYTNIHSSYQQLTWGDLLPKQVGMVNCRILEIDETFGSFLLEYEIAAENSNGGTDRFLVDEYFSIQWSAVRFYLMDYTRNVCEVMTNADYRVEEAGLNIGIQNPENVQTYWDEKAGRMLITIAGELFSYDANANELTRIFSFGSGADDPVRNERDFGIRILNTEEDGSVSFLVYGYMSSGAHEGHMGVSCLTYVAEENALSEKFFLPYDGNFETLSGDITTLAQMSGTGEVYLMVADTVYSIDWEGGDIVVLADNASKRNLVVNEQQTAIAWEMDSADGEFATVQILYLDNGESQIVAGSTGDRVTAAGFIDEDCVIGLGHEGDLAKAGAETVEPLYSVIIRERNGKESVRYEQENVYISHITVNEGQVMMERIRREGSGYVQIESDTLIRNSPVKEEEKDWLGTETDAKKETTQVLRLPSTGRLSIKDPEGVHFAAADAFKLTEREKELVYYGYGRGRLVVITETAGEAVNAVYDMMGAVVDSKGRLVWRRTGRQDMRNLNTGAGTAVSAADSLNACMRKLLEIRNMNTSVLSEFDENTSPMEMMDEIFAGGGVNLTGSPMRALLMFINDGRPVLLTDSAGTAKLLVGYDQWNVIYYDPLTGETVKQGQNDATEWLAKENINVIGFLE